FALQDSLANFAAGGMILIYKPFDVDDFVHVAGQEGLVKKMSLVSTTINTFDNQTLIIPNNKIWGDVIRNVTAQRVRRIDLEFSVSYNSDIEQVERVLLEVAGAHPGVLPEPETRVRIGSLGESSINFLLRPWAKRDDVWDVRWDLIRAVKMRFDEEGIQIPFPQRDVHISYRDKAEEEPQSDSHQGKE
ncbi:MAG: mechanosensitive ion channel family protein, partial [Actinobacteria bacterium]|nr:mechanosensitive ion channel family protein [Actinomycetota bacterium]